MDTTSTTDARRPPSAAPAALIRRAPLRLVAAVAAVAVMTLGLWGCGDDDTGSDMAELGVVASGSHADGAGGTAQYSFEMPDRVEAGPTRISLTNDGDEQHHAQLFRLNDGATVSDLAAALAAGGPPAALEHGTFEGGTALVAPGETSRAEAVVDLAEGDYAFICFVEGPDGVPHLAHGMLRPFEVTATGDPSPAPTADLAVQLVDYSFDLPDTIPGDALLTVTNAADAEPHEMIVARLDDGATTDEVLAALADGTQPPVTALGGMQAILPGATQSLQLDLEPGRYVVICEVPSQADGMPHHSKGMIREVTVT